MRQSFQFECISGEFVVRFITGRPQSLCVQPMLFVVDLLFALLIAIYR